MKYRSLKHWKYELLEGMECKTDIRDAPTIDEPYITLLPTGWLTVGERYAWDGASFIAKDTPTNMRASLFHDALCQLINEGLLDKKYRKYADELLRTHMLEDQAEAAEEMKPWKRAIYLRWGRFRANGYYNFVRAYSKLKGM